MAKSKRKVKVVKPISIKVKFLVDCQLGPEDPLFEADSIHELKAATAMRWIRRGKAVRYIEPPPAKRKAGRPPKKKEPEVEPEIEEKKIEDFLGLPSSPPITVTDATPEIEKE